MHLPSPLKLADNKKSFTRSHAIGARNGHAQKLTIFQKGQLVSRRVASYGLSFGISKTTPHGIWTTNCQTIDLSFIDLRIQLHAFLFLKSIQREVVISIISWVQFFLWLCFGPFPFLIWKCRYLFILSLSPSLFFGTQQREISQTIISAWFVKSLDIFTHNLFAELIFVRILEVTALSWVFITIIWQKHYITNRIPCKRIANRLLYYYWLLTSLSFLLCYFYRDYQVVIVQPLIKQRKRETTNF